MTAGLSNIATKKRELVEKAKRDPSTAVSRGIDRVPGNSSQVGSENDIASNFGVLFEGATLRLKEESQYRMFIDLERIAAETPTAIWHSKGGPREVTIWCSNDYLGMSQTQPWSRPWSTRHFVWAPVRGHSQHWRTNDP